MSRCIALSLSCLIAAIAVAGCGDDNAGDGDTGASTDGTFVGTGTNRAVLTVPVQLKTVGSWKSIDAAANLYEQDPGTTTVALVIGSPGKDLDTIEVALLEGDCEEAAAPDDDDDPFVDAKPAIGFAGALEDFTDGNTAVFVREKKGDRVVACGAIPKLDTSEVTTPPTSTTSVNVPGRKRGRTTGTSGG